MNSIAPVLSWNPTQVTTQFLGDVATIQTGEKPTEEQFAAGGDFAYLNGGVSPSGFVGEANTPGETIAIPSRGSVGKVAWSSRPFWCGPLSYRIRPMDQIGLSTRFLYFYLKNIEPEIVSLQQSGSIPALNKAQLSRVRIEIPPIDVQNEIVRILDTFLALEVELEAELEARTEQYQYYRDSLLEPKIGEFKRVPLREICAVVNGYAFKSELFNTEDLGLPLIRIRDVNTGISGTYYSGFYEDKYLVQPGDLLIGMDGDFNAIRWPHGQALLNQRVCRLQDFSQETLPGYVFHWVRDAVKAIQRATSASTVKHLSSRQIGDIMIPIPDIEYQRNAVDLLDRLDALVSGPAQGIPEEIAARRRQYEYYRGQLLTFEVA